MDIVCFRNTIVILIVIFGSSSSSWNTFVQNGFLTRKPFLKLIKIEIMKELLHITIINQLNSMLTMNNNNFQ